MLTVYIKAIGLVAPGMKNWHEAVSVLNKTEHYVSEPVARKLDTLLAANERRRASRVTQLALYAAQQTGSAEELSQCLQIFSCCNGDLSTFHQISLALSMQGRPVSPTRFHNSVHNAASGYWSIATQSQTPSTSITAYNDSAAAGLLEAAVQLNSADNEQERDCLLVCYDEVPPASFSTLIPNTHEFSCALRLSLSAENALYQMDISINEASSDSVTEVVMSSEAMEALRISNPQAALLPLLDSIAKQRDEVVSLAYFEQILNIQLTSCANQK